MYGQKLKRLRIVASGLMLCLMVLFLLVSTMPVLAQSDINNNIGAATGFNYTMQNKSFYANGRYWVFFVRSGVNGLRYHSSTNGTVWSAENTVVMNSTVTGPFSVMHDGIYAHVVINATIGGLSRLWYIRGLTASDGTITWDAVDDAYGSISNYNSIAIDSNGFPWVTRSSDSLNIVAKSSTKDGTWTTDFSSTPAVMGATSIYALTSGKMLLLGQKDATHRLTAIHYTGAAWGAEVQTTSAIERTGAFGAHMYSAVAQDDDVHIVFLKDVTDDIVYTKYNYSTNSFSPEIVLYSGATATSAPKIQLNSDNNDLYVYWENDPTDDHVYYIRYDANDDTWDTYEDWINEAVIDTLPATGYYINCNYICDSSTAGLYYIAAVAKLKWKKLDLPTDVITLPATAITSSSASIRGEILGIGSGTPVFRGFDWGTAWDLSSYTTVGETGSFGMGVYSHTLTGLDSDTLYYYRATVMDEGNVTYTGNITSFLTLQSSWVPPDDPDDPDIVPPLPPEPGGWIDNSKTYDSWPFSDLVNTFADNVSRSFVWFAIMVVAVCGIGLLVTGWTKHLGITFLVMGVCLGIFIAGGYLDWWIMLPYLLVGIALITKEQQWGW